MSLTDALIPLKKGEYRFFMEQAALDRGVRLEELIRADELLKTGKILKDSRTTTAAAVTLPSGGEPFFLKRTNNKGFSFTLRYLFRKARACRAAEAILHLTANRIPTPALMGWGERRTCLGKLRSGYLLTAFLPEAVQGDAMLAKDPEKTIEECALLIAQMHTSGLYHGDCKLQNFYAVSGAFGVWDLDGGVIFENGVPRQQRLDDLGRLAWSCRELKVSLSDEEVCRIIGENYPPETKICRHCVAKALAQRASR